MRKSPRTILFNYKLSLILIRLFWENSFLAEVFDLIPLWKSWAVENFGKGSKIQSHSEIITSLKDALFEAYKHDNKTNGLTRSKIFKIINKYSKNCFKFFIVEFENTRNPNSDYVLSKCHKRDKIRLNDRTWPNFRALFMNLINKLWKNLLKNS